MSVTLPRPGLAPPGTVQDHASAPLAGALFAPSATFAPFAGGAKARSHLAFGAAFTLALAVPPGLAPTTAEIVGAAAGALVGGCDGFGLVADGADLAVGDSAGAVVAVGLGAVGEGAAVGDAADVGEAAGVGVAGGSVGEAAPYSTGVGLVATALGVAEGRAAEEPPQAASVTAIRASRSVARTAPAGRAFSRSITRETRCRDCRHRRPLDQGRPPSGL